MGKKKHHYPTFDMHVMPLFQSHKSDPQWMVGTCTTRTYIPLLITNEFTAKAAGQNKLKTAKLRLFYRELPGA